MFAIRNYYKLYTCLLICNGIVSLFLFCVSTTYASTYGESTYGSGVYNAAATTPPTPTPTTLGASSNSTSPTPPPGCTDQAPSAAPYLFQVDRNMTSATLFITPQASSVTGYYVIYGTKLGEERFGVSFDNSDTSGVVSYAINDLSIYTDYAFKVTARNGCALGLFSNSILAPKNVNHRTKKTSYYPSIGDKLYFPIQNAVQKAQGFISTKFGIKKNAVVPAEIEAAEKVQPILTTSLTVAPPTQPTALKQPVTQNSFTPILYATPQKRPGIFSWLWQKIKSLF